MFNNLLKGDFFTMAVENKKNTQIAIPYLLPAV